MHSGGKLLCARYQISCTTIIINHVKFTLFINTNKRVLIYSQTTGANAVSDVERTLKSLNGYHEDILEALRNAAQSTHRSSGNTPSGSISEEILRKTLQECAAGTLNYEFKRGGSKNSSRENICENNPQLNAILSDSAGALLHHHRSQQQLHQPQLQQAPQTAPQSLQQTATQQINPDDEVGPLRIRNLEDLIRQLEHHSSRHMSPSGSEDINNSYGYVCMYICANVDIKIIHLTCHSSSVHTLPLQTNMLIKSIYLNSISL